jgi:ATP-binding cassette subfamily C protein
MFAIFGYLWFMMIPVQDVLNIQFQWFAARAALERIDRLLGLETEPHSHGHWTPGTRGLSLEVQRLGFAWPNGDQGIQDLGFSVPAGSGLGIVGASGGGKSTLIHLLLGLSPPDRGQIFWNGRPAEAIGLYALRRHIGVVLQDPVILNGTVRENLCLGLQVEEAVLWEAMKVVCIDTVVREMTDGLDTLLGRRGVRLSGGQRQRLALARVLIQQPACLILDEATSALDTRTEMQVLENLRQALPDATLIVVAHRLSALRFASQILVIEDGRMVEKGAPDELLQQDGVFRLLYGA